MVEEKLVHACINFIEPDFLDQPGLFRHQVRNVRTRARACVRARARDVCVRACVRACVCA